MASTRLKSTKDGRDYYEIRCRVSRDRPELTTRWYIPDGWGKKAIERELAKQVADFERRCRAGEVLTRSERKQADAEIAQKMAQILTLKEYGERVFMPAKAITCSENTRSSFQGILNNHVYPALGGNKITEISSAQITALLLSIQAEGKSHATCVKIYTVISLLFKMAYMSDSIPRNPMDKVERPKPRKADSKGAEVDAYTADEIKEILRCLENEPLKWQAYIHLLIDTGMRRGECCGLMWKHIDFQNSRIEIRQTLNYTKDAGIYLDTPKNGKTRTVDVGAPVMSLLKLWRREQAEAGISQYVFTQDDSIEPMHPQTPTRYMSKFSDRHGIKDMHPHKLRHSFASIAITGGADIASVSEILGHSDKAVTLRVYSHANEESKKRASEIFRSALNDRKEA